MNDRTNGIAKDVGGVAVDRVLVSQATRDMAAGRVKLRDLAEEIRVLDAEHEAMLARKRQIEARLGQLNGRVIGAGHLPGLTYRSIVEEQNSLKRELGDNLAESSTLKLKIEKLKHRQREERAERPSPSSEPMSPILREILGELRSIRVLLEQKKQAATEAAARS